MSSSSSRTDQETESRSGRGIWDALFELLRANMPMPAAIEQCAVVIERLTGAKGLTIFAISHSMKRIQAVAHRGEVEIPCPGYGAEPAPKTEHLRHEPLTAQGIQVGWLALAESHGLTEQQQTFFNSACTFLALLVDLHMQRTERSQQQSRVSQLSHLHALIMSGSNLDEVLRTSCREIALHLSADCAICILKNSGVPMQFTIRGSFGFPPHYCGSSMQLEHTSIGRAFRVGGLGSIPDLSAHSRHGLQLFSDYGMKSAHWCCIDGQNELLGSILVGFKRHRELQDFEWTLLEECSQSAAIAVVTNHQRTMLDEFSQRFEELVGERTAELTFERKRADQENEAKSRFVADMSHELRTPLTAIVGYSSVIARGVFGEITDAQRDALMSVTRAAEHLKDLLNEVLQIAKVEAGREQVQPSAFEVGSLIRQVVRMMLQAANSKNISIFSLADDAPEQSLKLWVDQRHARQIMLNLVSNAIKYTHPGGKVTITVEKLADKLKISVADTGVGIGTEEQSSVFERFTRGSHCYSQSQLGTGLGLPLTKELVESNGGLIGVQSTPGEGSTFWVLLPQADETIVAESDLVSKQAPYEQALYRLDGLQILIADDSKLTCEVLQSVIRKLGGTPLVAHSVKDALDVAQFTQFDAVLVDLAFPGENGLQLIDYFVEANQRSKISVPVLTISACVLEQAQQEALDRGAAMFIAKPFDPMEVVYWIRTLVTSSILAAQSQL